jgi:hypothetical protein
MPSRAQTLRRAAVQRRRLAIIEAAYEPKIAAELARVAKEAASVYPSGGIAAVEALSEQHIENTAKILQDMFKACAKTEERRLRELYKSLPMVIEKKDEMEQAMTLLNEVWFSESFSASQFIAATTLENLRAATAKGLAEGLNEEGMARYIIESQEGLAPWRAKTIARTEAHSAIMQSQHEITKSLDLPEHAREWVSAGVRARKAHEAADGQKRLPDTPFDVGKEKLMYPGQRGGNPANFVNCLLPNNRVSCVNPMRIFRNSYVGEVIEIKLLGGEILTVTPNHPIMTTAGFCRASQIFKGDNLIVHNGGDAFTPEGLYVEGVYPTVSELYDSLNESGVSMRVDSSVVDFHGDIPNSNVEIIDVGLSLRDGRQTKTLEGLKDIAFKLPYAVGRVLVSDRSFDHFLHAASLSSDGSMSLLSKFFHILRASFGKSDFVGLASIADFEAEVFKTGENKGPSSPNCLAHLQDAYPLFVHLFNLFVVLQTLSKELTTRRVISTRVFHYDGPVYNIEDEKTLYCASTILNHNCRCVVSESFDPEDIAEAQ